MPEIVISPQAMLKAKQEELAAEEAKLRLIEGLPHLHGRKWYKWAWDFFESRNKINLLTAGNQLSKSSSAIRKCIHWATAVDLWPELWPAGKPKQFWYFYPTAAQASIEFEEKWDEFLPRNEYKNHPIYGWRSEKKNKEIFAIHFNSGVTVYFKSYAQGLEALQTGTVDAMWCFVAGTKVITPDGEVPVESVRSGDTVLSKDGWARVRRTMNREQFVITVKFSDGSELTGTKEHPIWTENRGWASLGDLLPNDICIKTPPCLRAFLPMLKWCYSKGFFTTGGRSTPTAENGAISGVPASSSMLRFGSRIMVAAFQRAMLFTIEMTTRWTIGLKISSSLPAKNTPSITSEKSGSQRGHTHTSATTAGQTSSPEAQKARSQDTALLSVVRQFTARSLSALGAALRSPFEAILPRFIVPISVSTEPSTSRVFNIEVEGSHTYFANGILTHNCDEETPVDLYGELMFRLSASDGYFHAVFTATMGQEFWRLVMEPQEHEEEKLPQAFKQQVSAYDCQIYMDGTKSHWTDAKINQVIARCADHDEVLRRVWGRFIRNKSGRKFEQFDIKRHIKLAHPIPRSWLIYAGADVGSGGEEGHPAAITFVAVSPDFKQGRVFLGWRGDGMTTTAGDVVRKFIELKKQHNLVMSGQYYDWASADFYNIATQLHEPFEKANKGHEGYDTLNTLFKNDMLFLYDIPELRKLATELSGLRKETRKTKAIDDFCDSLRYACASIPWDWSAITGVKVQGDPEPDPKETALTPMQQEIADRRQAFMETAFDSGASGIEHEIAEWNDLYGE